MEFLVDSRGLTVYIFRASMNVFDLLYDPPSLNLPSSCLSLPPSSTSFFIHPRSASLLSFPTPNMLPSKKDATGTTRSREVALHARDAITHQYATSTKKETKTPSTKKSSDPVQRPGPVLPPGPVRHTVSMNKTPGSNKREPVVLSSDEENQPPLKRQFPNTPASSGSHSQP